MKTIGLIACIILIISSIVAGHYNKCKTYNLKTNIGTVLGSIIASVFKGFMWWYVIEYFR